jgi:hypothetical protein
MEDQSKAKPLFLNLIQGNITSSNKSAISNSSERNKSEMPVKTGIMAFPQHLMKKISTELEVLDEVEEEVV